MQDWGMKLVTMGVTADTLNGKLSANISQYVGSQNYRMKSMGQDFKVPLRTKTLKYSQAFRYLRFNNQRFENLLRDERREEGR